jgi:hypothetical protein
MFRRMSAPTPLVRDTRDPIAIAWGDLIRSKRLSGRFVPDAPKLENGGNRQVDFAAYLGITQGQLSAWESGKSCPSAHWQARIVRSLAIDPVELHATVTKGAA